MLFIRPLGKHAKKKRESKTRQDWKLYKPLVWFEEDSLWKSFKEKQKLQP